MICIYVNSIRPDPTCDCNNTLYYKTVGLQVPPQKVFGPSKPTPNTFVKGTWSPRDRVCFKFITIAVYSKIYLGSARPHPFCRLQIC